MCKCLMGQYLVTSVSHWKRCFCWLFDITGLLILRTSLRRECLFPLWRDVWKEGSFCSNVLPEGVTRFEKDSSSAKTDKDILHLDVTTAGDLFAISISSKNYHSIEMKQSGGGKEQIMRTHSCPLLPWLKDYCQYNNPDIHWAPPNIYSWYLDSFFFFMFESISSKMYHSLR